MSIAIIIRGPAGSGKSEIARQLKREIPTLIHLDIDLFKHVISSESSVVRSRIAHKVGSFFLKELIKNKFDIVVEEIFREDYYLEVVAILKKSRYNMITIFLSASKDVLIKRDKDRMKNKGSKVITQLHKEIIPFQGDFIIDTTHKSIKEIKSIILKKLVSDKYL